MLKEFQVKKPLAGIHYIAEEKLNEISALVNQYRYAESTYSGISNMSKEITIKNLRAISLHSFSGLAKETLENFKKDQIFIRIQNWQNKQLLLFLKPSFWSKIKSPYLHELKHLICPYTSFSSDALNKMIFNYLPNIEKQIKNLIKLANQEFNRNSKILKKNTEFMTIYKKYINYFENYLNEIKEEKKRLSEAVFQRLIFSSYSKNLKQDDILYSITEKINKKENLKLELSEKRRQGLNIKLINKFYSFIKENGSNEQKIRLSNLSWKLPKEDMVYIIRNANFLIIPYSLIDYIPLRMGYPFQFLKNMRYKLAIHFQIVIKHLNEIEIPEIINSKNTVNYFSEINIQDNLINDAITLLKEIMIIWVIGKCIFIKRKILLLKIKLM
ncbi:MAG: hypothetical protein LEGION0398_MBIBDBAK_01213 [Legionellaceae bacterium]